MTSTSVDEWPTDPDRLASIASNPTHPQEMRNDALQKLKPLIHQVARRVTARFAGPYIDDLLGEAEGEVWLAIKGFQSGNSFADWCYGVLRNHLLDRFRKEQRDQNRRAKVAVQEEMDGFQRDLERMLDQNALFSHPDLETVRTWPLLGRLVLLALSGLWEQVAREEWEDWVEEYRTNRDNDLPVPFPPKQLQGCDDISERYAVLSGAMKIPRNTLSVWLFRYKGRLRNLQYVREKLDNT